MQLIGSGTILRESIFAAELLQNDFEYRRQMSGRRRR